MAELCDIAVNYSTRPHRGLLSLNSIQRDCARRPLSGSKGVVCYDEQPMLLWIDGSSRFGCRSTSAWLRKRTRDSEKQKSRRRVEIGQRSVIQNPKLAASNHAL